MANTVIAIKKSATPAAQPTVLANGELAINYADGKLFYKHANGTILPFNTQGGNAFGTVNANGTLVVAGSSEAVVTLIAGNNISIIGDAINDTVTIESTGGGIAIAAYDKANAANLNAKTANDKANNALANSTGTFAGNLTVTGNVTVSGTVTAQHFDNVSDSVFKDNIDIIYNATSVINKLNPVSFTWKNTDKQSYGLIAQEVEKILPSIVNIKEDETKTVSYIQLIPFLIQAIKELQHKVDNINNNKA